VAGKKGKDVPFLAESIFEAPRGYQLLFIPDTLMTYWRNNFSAVLK